MPGVNLLTTLVSPHLDRLGDLNPQLMREWKGRLKRFPVITAIVLSVLCQIAIVVGFWTALPGPVVLKDMRLSTYPKIAWRSDTQLSPKPLQDILPLDMAHRDRAIRSGVVVDWMEVSEPIQGDKTLGLNALKTMKMGDRLIKIDGQLVNPNGDQLNGDDWEYKVSDLTRDLDNKILKHPHQPMTPQLQKLLGTTVNLELYNADRGYYTVTLPRIAAANKTSPYCILEQHDDIIHGKNVTYRNSCRITQDKQSYQIDWPQWYGHIYLCVSILMVFPLMGVGVFMLANNLADEKRRGTLNFLQLSPKSAFTILSGKLLGVPVCLYLAIGLLFPLHWLVGLRAGYNIAHLIGFDLILISQTLIFYLGTLLLSLSVSQPMVLALQPWLLAAGTIGFHWITFFYVGSGEFTRNTQANVLLWSVLFSPFSSLAYFNFEQAAATPNINVALGDFRLNFTEYVSLSLIHAAGWYTLLGHGLERCFSNSDITLLKRRFSYLLTLLFATLMVGLTGTRLKSHDASFNLTVIMIMSLIYCIGLVVALSPARQTLKDWTRFRHAKPRQERLALSKDLVIGDTSSPVVAIALNLLLLTSIVVLAFYQYYSDWFPNRLDALTFAGCVLMFIGSILFSTLISQTFLMLPLQKNWIWLGVMGSISCLAFPALSMVMGFAVFSASPDPTHLLGIPSQLAIVVLPLSLLSTLTVILGVIHTRQLIRSGHSESRQLLSQT